MVYVLVIIWHVRESMDIGHMPSCCVAYLISLLQINERLQPGGGEAN